MGIFKKLTEFEKKYALSTWAFIFALITGIPATYFLFKDNRPKLDFSITSNVSVFDIKEDLGNLDVIYNGESLSNNNEELKSITLKMANIGSGSILLTSYDDNDPVGFEIIDGRLTNQPTIIAASNNYLSNNTKPITSGNNVVFPKLIFESGEFVELKMLIIHHKNSMPEILPHGKIAGITEDFFVNINQYKPSKSAFELIGTMTFSQIVALFSPIVSMTLAFLSLLFFITLKCMYYYRILKRKSLVNSFIREGNVRVSQLDNELLNYYAKLGDYFSTRLVEMLACKDYLELIMSSVDLTKEFKSKDVSEFSSDRMILWFIKNNFIHIQDDKVTVDPELSKVFIEFHRYLHKLSKLKYMDYIFIPKSEREKNPESKYKNVEFIVVDIFKM